MCQAWFKCYRPWDKQNRQGPSPHRACFLVHLSLLILQFSSVQFSRSVMSDYLWPPWTTTHQASLSITNCWSLPKPVSIDSVMPSNHLILCHPLLLLPSIFPSIRFFSNESGLRIRWSKYWSFSFSVSPSNEHAGLSSFRMDWLDLLAVQGTLKSLLQHHSSEASIFRHSAFSTFQLSHPYMTPEKKQNKTKHNFDYMDPCQQSNVSAF